MKSVRMNTKNLHAFSGWLFNDLNTKKVSTLVESVLPTLPILYLPFQGPVKKFFPLYTIKYAYLNIYLSFVNFSPHVYTIQILNLNLCPYPLINIKFVM